MSIEETERNVPHAAVNFLGLMYVSENYQSCENISIKQYE